MSQHEGNVSILLQFYCLFLGHALCGCTKRVLMVGSNLRCFHQFKSVSLTKCQTPTTIPHAVRLSPSIAKYYQNEITHHAPSSSATSSTSCYY